MLNNYKDELREKLLSKIEDLQSKIKNNEDFPHGSQDIDFLVEVSDNIDECLNAWYY